MKFLFLFLFLLASCFSAEIEGFRDLKWGDSPDKLGKFKVIDKNINEKKLMCIKEKEQLMIGDVKLDGIQYVFFDNKLTRVDMNFSGQDSLLKIRKAFETKYQASWIQPNRYIEEYGFVGKDFNAILIGCKLSYKKCSASIVNNELSKEMYKYEDSVAKKGAKDL